MENKIIKDRDTTEKKILDAVGEIIAEYGFEKVGINLVAQKAGISKILIYRYFGSIDALIAEYIFKEDFWINISVSKSELMDIKEYLKRMFREQISQLRNDMTLKRLYRWELSTSNPVTAQLREKREENGGKLIKMISQLTGSSQKEVVSLASIISASVSYLVLLEELCPTYNGINLQSDKGWEEIIYGIDLIIDLWLNNLKQ